MVVPEQRPRLLNNFIQVMNLKNGDLENEYRGLQTNKK